MSRKARDPWKHLLGKLKNSAKCSYKAGSRHHEKKVITVTPEELAVMFKKQGGRCYWLGNKIDPAGIFTPWNHLAPSLDRIDSAKPYSADNVVITTRFANLGRGRLTTEQFKPMARKLRKMIANEFWPKFLFDEVQPCNPVIADLAPSADAEKGTELSPDAP